MQYGLADRFYDELPYIREIMFDVNDDTARMIYADWLDERNDRRGEFLRLDMMMCNVKASEAELQRLRERRENLVQQIDPQWVSLLARVPIELCPQKIKFQVMCPKRWENLQPFGDDQSVRYCDQCGRSVTYCFSLTDARQKASRDQCVAIDPGVGRTADDLVRVESPYYRALLGLIADAE